MSSARQRSPSLLTLSIRPRTVTSRHSWARPGERYRSIGVGTAAVPSRSIRVAASRGAPYDVPTEPSMRTRDPTAGAVAADGARTSIAPDPSWTTKSLPLPSSSDAGAVMTATIATDRPRVRFAAVIEIGRAAEGPADADGVGLGVGAAVADGVGIGAGAITATSAA